jgi:hypothetical protein
VLIALMARIIVIPAEHNVPVALKPMIRWRKSGFSLSIFCKRPKIMHQTHPTRLRTSLPRTCIVIAASAFFVAGCASVSTSGGGSSGGGIELPGGGSSGGGMPGGSSGGGMPGGSSGGGMPGGSSGGGMPGGSSGGGMPGGSSGDGSSGGSGGAGGSGPMESVEIPGDGEGGGSECGDDGVMGGGIGGGMGCEGDQSGSVGEFPGGDAERAEQLGKELDESVGDFDEVLMEEQRDIETVGRNTEGYGTGSGSGSGGNISLGEQAAGAQGGASGGAAGGGGGGGGAGSSDPLAGMSEGEIEKRTPDDIEVMMDDDIVAKQLREAALAEDDPELRERLWEEYRKYKGM